MTQDFETMMKSLESIVNQLDSEQVSLEQSIELYEKGVKLSAECEQVLKAAEEKINKLKKNEDSNNE
ncbi:exodeoxyribonuclease VII small subunit [Macrococcus sp. DPC7161]|uniref:exodeoxyribonuclease VII small subunit n=1 Tax=Macrococcus sp. DPC7161 TaxID=2507060 RepID=UPI00100BD666|nr:exodeoxyribonuclease VII small subunit [Macrococcus sp. DPC7161]RXK19335.1 exodeoxyribonuclease VII small subunit [Macrococcus sp. DPC7161]